jgi:hypothetical protein
MDRLLKLRYMNAAWFDMKKPQKLVANFWGSVQQVFCFLASKSA